MADGGCGRRPGPDEITIARLGLDDTETAALGVMRHLFETFACPEGQGWLRALALAEMVQPERPGEFALALVRVVQAMRGARRSPFLFTSPGCPCCAPRLTEPERHLMSALMAVRRGTPARARVSTMLLCEGHDDSALLLALERLAEGWPARRRLHADG